MTTVRQKQAERGPMRISRKTVDHVLTELLDTVVDDIPYAPNVVAGIMADAASIIQSLRRTRP